MNSHSIEGSDESALSNRIVSTRLNLAICQWQLSSLSIPKQPLKPVFHKATFFERSERLLKLNRFLISSSWELTRQKKKSLCAKKVTYWKTGLSGCLYGRRDGTFTGTGRLPGRNVYRDGTFIGRGRLTRRDVYRDGTPFIPGLHENV